MSYCKWCKYSNRKKDGVLINEDPSGIVESSFSGFLLLAFSLVSSVREELFLSIPVDLHDKHLAIPIHVCILHMSHKGTSISLHLLSQPEFLAGGELARPRPNPLAACVQKNSRSKYPNRELARRLPKRQLLEGVSSERFQCNIW